MGGKRLRNPARNKDFTDIEIEILSRNPNVKNVTSKQINYTDDFKLLFLSEYAIGKSPLQIFTEAGFDQKMIGQGRIDKAASRWRRKENRPGGVIDQKKGNSGRKQSTNSEINTMGELEYLRQQNAYLRQENTFLRELERLERQAMPHKK